jgi:tetratricopeptide (TPR) repeat protein
MTPATQVVYYVFRTLITVGTLSKNRFEKNYSIFRFLKSLKLARLHDDFDSIYFHTLYTVSENKSKELIQLFALKEVQEAFHEEFINDKADSFWRSFEDGLNTNHNPYIVKLKNQEVDINKEIEDFKREFKNTVKLTRKPKEKENSDTLEKIDTNLTKVLITGIKDDLKYATNLMESYDCEKALDYLENLRKKWPLISEGELRYKILANIGCCKLSMNNNKDAAIDLIAALEFYPNDAKALGFAALGYNISHNPEKANYFAEKSINKDSDNPICWACLISSIKTENDLNIILSRIPTQLENNSIISFAVFGFYARIGNIPLAKELLRKTVANDIKRSPDYLAALGQFSQGELLNSEEGQTGQISVDNKNDIGECISLLTEAIDKIKNHDLIKYRWWWYTSLASLKQLQNNFLGAQSDLREAYRLSDDNYNMMLYLVQNLVQCRLYPEALDIFNRLKSANPDDERNEVGIAHCLIGLKRQPEAIAILQKKIEETKDNNLRANIISALIRTGTDIGEFILAEGLVNDLIASSPDDITTYLEANYFYEGKGDFINAIKSILKAYDLAIEEKDKSIHYINLSDLAVLLLKYKEYSKAINIYIKFVDTSIHSRYIEHLVRAYVLNGDLNNAFEIIKRLKEKFGLTQSLVEAEIIVYETTGDLKKAIDVCEDFLKTDNNNQDILARLVNLYYRYSDKENIKKYIDLIKDFTIFPYDAGFRLAYILFTIGEIEKALETAWLIRSKNYSNGDAHWAFVQLAIYLKPEEIYLVDLLEVKENTAVQIRDVNDEKFTSVLIKGREIHGERSEISISSEDGEKLMGKKIGETIILSNSKSYTIVSISHKFIQAQAESILLLQTKFPNTKGFEFHKLKNDGNGPNEEDIKPITDLLDQKNEFTQTILNKYREGLLPIGFLASINGQNPIEVWGGVIGEGIGMFTFFHGNEYAIASGKLRTNNALLLDITAILTLSRIDMLEKIKESSIALFLSNSTLDLIKNQIEEQKKYGREGSLTIFKRDNIYYKNEVSKEVINKNIDFLNNLLSWIEHNCTILPCEGILTIEQSERDLRYKTFGKSFFESILIAQEKNILLFSDDGILRGVAKQEYQVDGISTSLLLQFLCDRKIITNPEYNEKLFILHLLNYKGTPINSEILWKALEKAEFNLKEPFTTVASVLSTIPYQQEIIVAKIITDFLYKLSIESIIRTNQNLICNYIFQCVIEQFTPQYFDIQIQFLKTKFMLLPIDSDRIIKNFIVCWNANR